MKKSFIVLLGLLLSITICSMVACSHQNDEGVLTGNKAEYVGEDISINDWRQLEAETSAYKNGKNYSMKMDGILDEEIWKSNSELSFTLYGVTIKVNTAYGENGFFVGATILDSKVFYNPNREIYLNPSIELYISPSEHKILSSHCIQVRSDISGKTETYYGANYPSMSYKWTKTYVPCNINIKVNGGYNNGKTESIIGEYYIPYSSLGLTEKPQEKIGIFPCYNHIISTSMSSGRQWCTGEGNYTAPGAYYLFDEKGYCGKPNEGNILGNGASGLAMSSGWKFGTENDRAESVKGGRQTIYFNKIAGNRYLVEAELEYVNSLETSDFAGIDALPKAGILFGSENTHRLSFLADYATSDASRRNKLNFLLQAPGWNMSPAYNSPINPLTEKPVFSDTHNEKIKLSVVKENKIIHCFVNDVYFMSKECIELTDSMDVGLITMGAGINFSSCKATQDEKEIRRYLSEKGLCNVSIEQSGVGGFVSSDKISVATGKSVTLKLETKNGYILDSLLVDNVQLKDNIIDGKLLINNIQGDIIIKPTFVIIQNPISLSGTVTIDGAEGRNSYVTAKNNDNNQFYKIIPNRIGGFEFNLVAGNYILQAHYNEFSSELKEINLTQNTANISLTISSEALVLGDSSCGLPMSGFWDIKYNNADHSSSSATPIGKLSGNKLYVKYKEDTHYIYSVTMDYDSVDSSDPAPKAGIIMAGKEGVRLTLMVDYTSASATQYKILNDLPKWNMQPIYTVNSNVNVKSTRYTVVRDNTNLYVFVGKNCIYKGEYASLNGIKTTGGVYILGAKPIYKDFSFINGKDAVREFLYHKISVNESVNGSVTCDKQFTEGREGVVFSVTSNSGYALSSIKINGVEFIDKMKLGKLSIDSVLEDLVVDATFMKTTLKKGKILIGQGIDLKFDEVFICYGDQVVNPNENGYFEINVPRSCTNLLIYSEKYRNLEDEFIHFTTAESDIGEYLINGYKLIPFSGCEISINSNIYIVKTNEGISFALLSGYELEDYSLKVRVKANSGKAGLVMKNNDFSFSYALFGKGDKGLEIVEFHNKLQYGILNTFNPINTLGFTNIEAGLNIELVRKGKNFYIFVENELAFSFTSIQTTIFTPARIGFITTGEAEYSEISLSQDKTYIGDKVKDLQLLTSNDIYIPQRNTVTDMLDNASGENSFIMLGDSNFDWWNSKEINRSEETVSKDFAFTDCPIINIGVAGSILENFIFNIDKIVALNPRAILIELGDNNCSIRNGYEMYALTVELTEALSVRLPNTKIFLTSIRHSGYRKAYANEITLANSLAKNYFEKNKHNNVFFIECESLFYSPDKENNDLSYFQSDQLHLTPKAYKKFLTVLQPVISEKLGEKYFVKVTNNDGGTALTDKQDLFSWGTATIKIRPYEDYEIKSIKVNGISQTIVGDFKLECLKTAMNVEIEFAKIKRAQYNVSGNIYGNINGSYLVNNGKEGLIKNGNINFKLPNGEYKVVFNIDGYLPCEKTITIVGVDIELGTLTELSPRLKAISGNVVLNKNELTLVPINSEGYAVFDGLSSDKYVMETKVKGIDISSIFGFTVINQKQGNVEYKGFIGCQIENSRIATLNNTYANGSSCWDNSGDIAPFDSQLSVNGVKLKLVRNVDDLYLFINDKLIGKSTISKEFTTTKNPAYNLTGDMDASFGIYSRSTVCFYDISFSIAESDILKEISNIK